MHRIIVPMVPPDAQVDSWHVNLPTYTVVEVSADGRVAVVDIPDGDVPGGFNINLPIRRIGATDGRDLVRAARAQMRLLYDHLDKRYAEHAGRFRPIDEG